MKTSPLLGLLSALFLPLSTGAGYAQQEHPAEILLWPAGAPGSEARAAEPEAFAKDSTTNVVNVHRPTITPFLPSPETATGTAVIIAPGGGHRILCLGHEGYALGEWFAAQGIAAFVLKYRLANEEGSTYTIADHAMADMRRAIRLVRSRAGEWGIKIDRLGVLGFSAGGELAAYAAMESDSGEATSADPIEQQGSRPDFQALIYPGKSDTFTVAAGMPPVFIAYGYHDRPDISRGMAEVYLKYLEAGVPAELHVYSNAKHGFGYKPGTTTAAGAWPERLREWLIDSGFLEDQQG